MILQQCGSYESCCCFWLVNYVYATGVNSNDMCTMQLSMADAYSGAVVVTNYYTNVFEDCSGYNCQFNNNEYDPIYVQSNPIVSVAGSDGCNDYLRSITFICRFSASQFYILSISKLWAKFDK